MSDGGLEFEALPPERRRSRSIIVASGSCCCCCCCCLHTIGGLVGAAIGTGTRDVTPGVNTGLADKLYWLNVSVLFMISVAYGMAVSGELVFAALGVALGLPAVQLLASVFAAGLVLISPAQNKGACLRRIGKITAWSVGLTFLGAAPFLVLGVVLN
jgi:streptolysin S family bacteriocin protoxin